jgi:hypothetical protein
MRTEQRSSAFDLLRAIMIASAAVLHFTGRYSLGVFAFPFQFVDSLFFNVGNFFFFTAGYMGYAVYSRRFGRKISAPSANLMKKGLRILFIYILFITAMRIFTNAGIPRNVYDFIWSHGFCATVLVTFSFVYFVSPAVILLFGKSRTVCFLLMILLYLCYVPEYAGVADDSYFFGIFFGTGGKSIYYPFFGSLIVYCMGFAAAFSESKFNMAPAKQTAVCAMAVLACHLACVAAFPPYGEFVRSRAIWLSATSILIYASVLSLRYFLSRKTPLSFFTKKAFLLIGVKSLTFYVLFNLFLGWLPIPNDLAVFRNVLIFGAIFLLTYLLTYLLSYRRYRAGVSGKPPAEAPPKPVVGRTADGNDPSGTY